MGDYLSVATVTAALRNILQIGTQNDLPGTQVSTVRPDTLNNAVKNRQINIYLYQTTPSQALRNVDLNARRPQSGITQTGSLGLDLHYLITFYGDESKLDQQQLLGIAVRTLIDYSVLTPEIIQNTLEHVPFLSESTLADRIQKVQFFPSTMTPDELSRIWSVLFQTPYCLTLPYQARAVIIEGERNGGSPLPVRRVNTHLVSARPIIYRIELDRTEKEASTAITAQSVLIIYGKQLQSAGTKVRVGEAIVTPDKVEEGEIRLNFSSLLASEKKDLKAGVQSLQIVRAMSARDKSKLDRATIESNAVPFVLCPTIVGNAIVSDLQKNWQELYSATITIRVDVKLNKKQRVFILLDRISNCEPSSYVFRAKEYKIDTNAIVFQVRDVKGGQYLLRVQIDGAESPLKVDTNPDSPTQEQYCEPKITLFIPT